VTIIVVNMSSFSSFKDKDINNINIDIALPYNSATIDKKLSRACLRELLKNLYSYKVKKNL
jgi:hypothetical protein